MALAAKNAKDKSTNKRGNAKEETKDDGRRIEKVLTGYNLRKDRIKKLAQQKMMQNEFKKKAKEQSAKDKVMNKEKNKDRDTKIENQQKRLKVMSKYTLK